MKNNTVKRKIHFFQIISNNCTFPEVLSIVNNLSEDKDMYSGDDEKKIYIEEFNKKNSYYTGIIRSIKMNNLPSKSKIGTRKPEPLNFSEDEGLGDATHFIFFPVSKILAVEYNHTGVRTAGIIDHVNQKLISNDVENNKNIKVFPLFSRDIIRKLDNIGEIKMLSFMIPKTRISDLKEIDNDLFESLDKIKNLWETQEIELVLRASPRSKKSILKDSSSFIKNLRSVFSKHPPSETFDRLKIKALDNKKNELHYFDLLEEKIESEVKVVKLNRTKEIDTENVFESIKSAFQDNKETLLGLLTPDKE